MSVTKGMTFRATYFDGRPLWKVVRQQGKGAWLCISQVEYFELNGIQHETDYCRIKKVFLDEEIINAKLVQQRYEESHQSTDDFYTNLTIGDICHYASCSDKWVRCEVIKDGEDYKLKPIALVGNWYKHDLPQRQRNGEIYYPYTSRLETITPSARCIYEYNRKGQDPRKLPAVDLSVPEMTPEEQKTANKWKVIDKIQNTCSDGHHGNDPQKVLDLILDLITTHLK